jgi:hypothetical protein
MTIKKNKPNSEVDLPQNVSPLYYFVYVSGLLAMLLTHDTNQKPNDTSPVQSVPAPKRKIDHTIWSISFVICCSFLKRKTVRSQ